MRINIDRLQRIGVSVRRTKDENSGDSVIDIQYDEGQYLELPTLVNDLREFGISTGIAHSIAEDVREEAHMQSLLQRIKDTA